jgi:hypothetical protein
MTKTPAAGGKLGININGAYVNIPGLEGIPEFGPEKSYYENTAIDDVAKTFNADLPDPGEFTLTGSWDSNNVAHQHMQAQSINASASDEMTAFFKSGAKAKVTGMIGSFRVSGQKGQDEKFSCKVRLSGAVNFTNA